MQTPHPSSHPFALMMNPAAVFHAMEHSDRLGALQRRVCRPLDRPLIARAPAELSEFDQAVDADDTDDTDDTGLIRD